MQIKINDILKDILKFSSGSRFIKENELSKYLDHMSLKANQPIWSFSKKKKYFQSIDRNKDGLVSSEELIEEIKKAMTP